MDIQNTTALLALQAILGSKNPIKKYEIGLPCMMGDVVGRIVGESEKGSWGEIGGEKMFSIPLFSTPHGTIIEIGILKLSEITEEGLKKLIEYEQGLFSENKEVYAGKINNFFSETLKEKQLEKKALDYINTITIITDNPVSVRIADFIAGYRLLEKELKNNNNL